MNEDHLERQHHIILAEALGITPDELEELMYELDFEESEDGLPYSVIVTFDAGNPPEIMEKIEALESGKYVYLQPGIFEGPDGPDDE